MQSGKQALSRRSAIGLVVMNALAGAAVVQAQFQQPKTPVGNVPDLSDASGHHQSDSENPLGERMKIAAEKSHNDDRRKRMLSDTDKLLALSTELKADIEKSTRDELSLEVIRKAAEIEKLAHDVQQRMKN